MKLKIALSLAVSFGFTGFCTGAIIAQHLTQNGYEMLSLRMGLPAWVVTLVCYWAIGRFAPDDSDHKSRQRSVIMKPEEQRIAIAEWCGWHHIRLNEHRGSVDGMLGPLRGWLPIPDYLIDLNAMHEAESHLNGNQVSYYFCELSLLGKQHASLHFQRWMPVICATAAQRAEALLRTIGKWTDHSTSETKWL